VSKAIVLFSGGLDSTTCLAIAVQKYGAENVIALSVYYGQKHDRELRSARNVCEYYGVQRKELNLEEIFMESNCSLLKKSTEDVPAGEYVEQLRKRKGEPVSTYVPFRNGLFLSCAASIAVANDCDAVYYGAHADDSAGNAYPDCSEVFNESIRNAIWEGSGKKVAVVAPFINRTKAEVVRKGLELNVPYELTWSCYEGGEKPCGICGTCLDRQKAFEENGVEDPLWKN